MTLIRTVDLVTKWIVIGTWVAYAAWQVVLVALRASGIQVKLISMTEKDLGYGLAALVYFWAGMATHWWATWHSPTWKSPIPGILFWAIGLAYLITDLVWPTPHGGASQWLVLRHPPVVLAIGAFCGWFLFPQGGQNWSPP
jgi:hypothetical protein